MFHTYFIQRIDRLFGDRTALFFYIFLWTAERCPLTDRPPKKQGQNTPEQSVLIFGKINANLISHKQLQLQIVQM